MGNANSSIKVAEKLDRRKCMISGCSGVMELRKCIPGGMTWCCDKDGNHRFRKEKDDYLKEDRDREWGKKE